MSSPGVNARRAARGGSNRGEPPDTATAMSGGCQRSWQALFPDPSLLLSLPLCPAALYRVRYKKNCYRSTLSTTQLGFWIKGKENQYSSAYKNEATCFGPARETCCGPTTFLLQPHSTNVSIAARRAMHSKAHSLFHARPHLAYPGFVLLPLRLDGVFRLVPPRFHEEAEQPANGSWLPHAPEHQADR